MKYLKKILVFLFLIPSINYSQTISDYGLKLGVASSKLKMAPISSGDNIIKAFTEVRLGPSMGIFVRFFNFNFMDIESDLFYLQKGGENRREIRTITSPEGTGKYMIFDIQFDYMQFQTCVRPKYSINNFQLYSLLGGSINYLLGSKGGVLLKEDYKNFVMGYSIGLGCSIDKIINYPIIIEIQHGSDITSLYQSDTVKYQNKIWLFVIGISLGKK